MVAEAYRQGVNYFDTCQNIAVNSEAVGRAVKGFRDKIIVINENSVRCLWKPEVIAVHWNMVILDENRTDHLDFYHFMGINRKEFDQIIMAQDLLADAAKAKEEGLIRHISFSFHDEPLAVLLLMSQKNAVFRWRVCLFITICLTEQMRKCFIMRHQWSWNNCDGSCRRRTDSGFRVDFVGLLENRIWHMGI